MTTIIAKVNMKNYGGHKPNEYIQYTFIYNDDYYKKIRYIDQDESSITLSNKIFLELGKPEFVGGFGKSVGFSPLEGFKNAANNGELIEVIDIIQ